MFQLDSIRNQFNFEVLMISAISDRLVRQVSFNGLGKMIQTVHNITFEMESDYLPT